VDKGIQAVQAWLSPLLKPYVIAAYSRIRMQHGLKVAASTSTSSTMNQVHIGGTTATKASDTSTISVLTSTLTQTVLSDDLGEVAPSGHLALFNQHAQQKKISVEWTFAVSEVTCENGTDTKSIAASVPTPIWKAQAIVKNRVIGEGMGRTKRVAKNAAARPALQSLGVKVYAA
jgi:ribonuclease III